MNDEVFVKSVLASKLYAMDHSQIKAKEQIEAEELLDEELLERGIVDPETRECGLPPDAVVAMTLWGEARGEGNLGIEAVASVILRRAMRRATMKDEPLDLAASRVCLAKAQFSCWNHEGKFVQSEPNDCQPWDECDMIARTLVAGHFKPVIVATHYYADYMDPAPSWANKMEYVGKIGHHLFYREW